MPAAKTHKGTSSDSTLLRGPALIAGLGACFGTEEEALLVEIVTHSYGAPLIAFAPLSLLASRSDKVNPCQIVTRDLDLDSWSCELSFTLKNGH